MKKASAALSQKNNVNKKEKIIFFLINSALLLLACLFFALAHPNLISLNGFPFIGYFAFVPLFVLIRRVSFKFSFLWGGVYGLLSYVFFTYWLAIFHPLAMYVIGIQYFFYCMLCIPLLKIADIVFPKKGYILQWAIWIAYEYIKSLWFLGYSYGIIGYSQWSWPFIIQIASIFGVWGVSALVAFPSAWLASVIKPNCIKPLKEWFTGFKHISKNQLISGLLWGIAFILASFYGIFFKLDYSDAPTKTVALIQPNSDPWLGGLETYRKDFESLVALSNAALDKNPTIDFVVWPETSFIPRIDWHYRYREDNESWSLVNELLQYLDTAPVPFIIGNDDAVMGPTWGGSWGRVDYNAVLLFRPQENVNPPKPEVYRKMHLVPFTEHFPYRKAFPWVYDLLVAADTHFWDKGDNPTVFTIDDLSFSTPICFEDTFGYISRLFVNEGANAIVNLTNDAWAKSKPCQYQHMSMAVFRAVENKVPLVRSTASGQSCIIDPNGIITAMGEPFAKTSVVGEIPVLLKNKKTVYTVIGDLFGVLFVCGSTIFLIGGLVYYKRNKRTQNT